MFERFTDRARRSLVLAQEEARRLGHNFIGTEHILLGLITEGSGVAAKVLTASGVTADATRAQVVAIVGNPETPAERRRGSFLSKQPPFTPRSKKVLELSLREALQLGHNYIGTEHMLLGLIREGEGVAAKALENLGVTQSDVRAKVIEALEGYRNTDPVSKRPLELGGLVAPNLSPAAREALDEAMAAAGDEPITTGRLLRALLDQTDSLAGRALAELGIHADAVDAALASIPFAATTDAPTPRVVEIVIGADRAEITDPELLRVLSPADRAKIEDLLREMLDRGKGEPPADAAG